MLLQFRGLALPLAAGVQRFADQLTVPQLIIVLTLAHLLERFVIAAKNVVGIVERHPYLTVTNPVKSLVFRPPGWSEV